MIVRILLYIARFLSRLASDLESNISTDKRMRKERPPFSHIILALIDLSTKTHNAETYLEFPEMR